MLSPGSSVDQVVDQVAHDGQELTGMKSQSAMAYLSESAAQVEILQLQSCQTFQVQLPVDLSTRDLHGLTGAALQAPHHGHTVGCNSKPFYQDGSMPEFAHDNFDDEQLITPAGLQEASAAGQLPGPGGGRGLQDDAPPLIPSVSTVIIIDNQLAVGGGGEPLQTTLQAPPNRGNELSGFQTSGVVDAPSVFYVKTPREAIEAVKKFEQQTGTKYSAYKSTAGFGSTVYDPAKPHKIYFEERSADPCSFGIPYDGIPFMNVGKKVMDCQYGMDRSVAAKRKYMERHLRDESRQKRPLAQERTKKVKCRAQIRMKEILKYSDFKVSPDSSSRKEKVPRSKALREALRNGTATGEKRIYIQVPSLSDHNGHPLGQDAVKQVKPCFSGKQAMREVNSLSWDAFIQRFGNVVEQGAVAASAVWSKRPFASLRALHSAFCEFVEDSSPSGKAAMFRCYPSLLAGASSTSGTLSPDCQTEFRHVGLGTLSPDESALLAQLDTKYRDIFQFSFVLCMQEADKEELWTGLHTRARNTTAIELATAAKEVKKIAWYRILDRVRGVRPK